MWGITIACLLALTLAGANGAFLENRVVSRDAEKSPLGFTNILLKALQPKDTLDIDQFSDNRQERSPVANAIRNLLESFRDVVINGSDDIPPLDPLVIDHLGPFVYTYTGVRLTANIRNFRMEGLQWYVVNDVSFDFFRRTGTVGLTAPWLVFTGTYDASAFIGFISHRAGGNFRIFINRIDVDVSLRLGTNIMGGHLLLRDLNIKIDVHDVQTQINGLTGSSMLNSLINTLLQSVTRDFINNEMENVSQIISEALFDVVNEFLKDFTLDDLRISH